MKTIDHQLAEIALQRVDGDSFEKFSQAFFGALSGTSFVPLGGTHDGGAEAFSESGIFEDGRPNHFWQASIEKNHRAKIRKTVARIREFGRDLNQLTYCTSIIIKNIDGEEDILGEELGLRIRIRDQKYIVSQINHSYATIQAFNSYLSPHLSFLKQLGGTTLLSHTPDLPTRTLCVFLGQEVDRRRGNSELLESVADSLILWALEDTNPDEGKFLKRDSIQDRIETALPASRHFIRGVLDNRLQALASKTNTSGREIRWYKKENKYCLTYETRLMVEKENVEDEFLKNSVTAVFRARATSLVDDELFEEVVPVVIEVCHRALEITFERQGLELSYFILGDDAEDHVGSSISENIDQAIDDLSVNPAHQMDVKEISVSILRQSFYQSEGCEREYLSKLSRTYTLLFVLKYEPRIVEYFRTMSRNFILFVGSDLIIRAMSEFFLAPEDRMTWNLFEILKAAGSECILTEKALNEVITHLQAADQEFKHNYAEIESTITREFARHINRILVRTYFYAKLDAGENDKVPTGWKGFLGQFCTYRDLYSDLGKDSLRRYLCEEFGFSYENSQEMSYKVDGEELDFLKEKLLEVRKKDRRGESIEEILAYNDALQVLRVYSKRHELKEASKPNPYGYRTWWLTHEMKILHATPDVVKKYGARYMMRPDFLLNFIALSPSAEEVRRSFGNIFPSLLGVKLSNRMRRDIFKEVVKRVNEVYKVNDARARALVGEYSDQIKGDFYKQYEASIQPPVE